MIGQAIHNNKTLSVFNIQVTHAGKLFGAGSVQYFQYARRTVHLDFLPVEVLYGRVIFFHEPAGHELHGQGALAHAARAQHDHFEFAHRRMTNDDKRLRIRIAMTGNWRHLTCLVMSTAVK